MWAQGNGNINGLQWRATLGKGPEGGGERPGPEEGSPVAATY